MKRSNATLPQTWVATYVPAKPSLNKDVLMNNTLITQFYQLAFTSTVVEKPFTDVRQPVHRLPVRWRNPLLSRTLTVPLVSVTPPPFSSSVVFRQTSNRPQPPNINPAKTLTSEINTSNGVASIAAPRTRMWAGLWGWPTPTAPKVTQQT